jgi:hypothetical protein
MTDHRSREAVEAAEAFADGHTVREQMINAHQGARMAMADADTVVMSLPVARRMAPWKSYKAAQAASYASAQRNTIQAYASAAEATFQRLGQINDEYRSQADLVRDIFGNPFRSMHVEPEWLTWNYATVPAIARHVYDDRAFHALPILADALEDAGCKNADLVDHCRGPGPHVRGCWAVDLLLGKS